MAKIKEEIKRMILRIFLYPIIFIPLFIIIDLPKIIWIILNLEIKSFEKVVIKRSWGENGKNKKY